MFLWNLFKITGKHFHIADGIFKIIEKSLNTLDASGPGDPIRKFEADNRALLMLLKGCCLKYMKSPLQALRCFEESISLQKSIKEDFFIIPYAIVEIGLLHIEQKNFDLATSCLEDAKKNYTGYSLESRLHFRIHTALSDLKGGPKENGINENIVN